MLFSDCESVERPRARFMKIFEEGSSLDKFLEGCKNVQTLILDKYLC